MQTMIPKTFEVDGIDGAFDCLVDTASFESEHTVAGERGKDAMVAGFLVNATYSPSVGDRLTIDEAIWVVSQVRTGPVKHELTLISDDE